MTATLSIHHGDDDDDDASKSRSAGRDATIAYHCRSLLVKLFATVSWNDCSKLQLTRHTTKL